MANCAFAHFVPKHTHRGRCGVTSSRELRLRIEGEKANNVMDIRRRPNDDILKSFSICREENSDNFLCFRNRNECLCMNE